jgi:ADP-heptose:LPS heptosyltransferase
VRLGERVAGVRKIVVLRANAIGDLIFSLPALAALAAAYPKAELVLLARAWHAEFLGQRPSPVDRVIVLPPISGLSLPERPGEDYRPPAAFMDALRAERFDVAVQLHGGGKSSNPFLAQLGARLTAGLRAPGSAPLDRWVRYVYFQPEVFRYLEVAALLGAAPVVLEPEIAVTARDRAESERVVPAGTPFAVLHPGASDERRRWSSARYARLGDRLHAAGLRVVLSGDGSEAELVRTVAEAMRAPALAAAGALSLGGLAGLLARARIVVGNDTGPLHLARAVGTPSVTLYWAGNLINGAPVTRHLHRALSSWQLDCPRCGVANVAVRCPHQSSFLDRVAYEEVEEQVFDVLEVAADQAGTSSAKRLSQA